ncbi:glycosyltransferase family 2 protein, partial [Acidisphaera rubrifaciens]|uniref:glycosyltransferase family 2 protein n=1 Tax=Acidisphaera rubrifaciens TaxID=50715 RepID=UPI0006623A17
MITRLGIGIATYNRRDLVLATVGRVLAHTVHPYTLAVADDGSRDGTADALRAQHVTTIAGPRRGTAWNKNRLLFYLVELARCDVVILLEDDTFPATRGWERDWILAAARHGHVNHAPAAIADTRLAGAGTGEDPYLAPMLTSHAAGFSREAVLFGGYFDTRFTFCGHENVEYAQRLLRHGYGGVQVAAHGGISAAFYLVRGGVTVTTPPSHVTEATLGRNREMAERIAGDAAPRTPWRDLNDMEQFRAELAGVYPRLRPPSASPRRGA